MKALQVIGTAYRCNHEEQDDPAVWITHAMKGAGADLGVLLRGNAVNYVVGAQDASGLTLGDWHQTQPPRIPADVASLLSKGIEVYVVAEDATHRGIEADDMIEGVQSIDRGALPGLFGRFDQVWHW